MNSHFLAHCAKLPIVSSSAWSIERWRLAGLFASIFAIGFLSGSWLLAVVVPMGIYIAWLLYQLYRLEIWLRTGARKRSAPNGSGIWASIVQLVYRNRSKGRLRKRRLAELSKRFNVTVSALPEATVSLTQDNEIEWSNPQAAQLLGIERHRDRGQRIDNLIRAPRFQRFLAAPIDAQTLLELPSPINAQLLLSIRRIPYGEGQSLITAHDISQSAALQRIRKEFIANVSHELRTPLTVILGYLESLGGSADLAENLRTPLRQCFQQTQRMHQLIEDLLVLSSLETDEPLGGATPTAQDMPQILAQIETEIRDTDMLSQRTLSLDATAGLHLLGIPSELDSLARNLIYNAIRHTPYDTRIEVTWADDENQGATLRVNDDGEGIDAEHLPHLTERFYRVDAARSQASGGTGLGLAIVKHIVQRHDGELQIQSTPGVGTHIQISFPGHRVVQNLPSTSD